MQDAYGNYQVDMTPFPADPPAAIGFIVFSNGDPNTTQPPAGPNYFAFDTVGKVLYYTADGTTWTAVSGGGGGGNQVVTGSGAPSSHTAGQLIYMDTLNSNFYYWSGSAWILFG